MKRYIAVLILLMNLFLYGCGDSEKLKPHGPLEDEVTLKFYFGGDKMSATDEVWNEVSEYVKKKGLNVRFEIHFIPYSEFTKKMLAMSAAGDTWDMNYDAEWLSYYSMVSRGSYLALNELLPKHAPHLYIKYKDQGILHAAMANGEQIVSLPWTMTMNMRPFAQWRSDLAKKAGINPAPDSIRTIEDLDAFLHQLKQAYPNEKITRSIPLNIFQLKHEWVDIRFHNFGYYLDEPAITIRALEQQPFYKEAVALAKNWFDQGILYNDAILDKEDGAVAWRNGSLLYTSQSHEWVYAEQGFSNPSFQQEHSLLYPDKKFLNRTSLANVIAINRNSKHPDRVLRFLDMLETDRELYDLVLYGINGKTYVLDGDKAVYPQGMQTTTSNYMEWGGQWAFWKPQFMRPTSTYDQDFWVREAEFASLPNNMNSQIDGLFFSSKNIEHEIVLRDQINAKYGAQLDFGITPNVDQSVEAYVKLQQQSGLQKIIDDVQRQVDEYIKFTK